MKSRKLIVGQPYVGRHFQPKFCRELAFVSVGKNGLIDAVVLIADATLSRSIQPALQAQYEKIFMRRDIIAGAGVAWTEAIEKQLRVP